VNRYEKHAPPFDVKTPRTSAFWSWEDHRVHLEHVGDPDAPVRIILVHGAGGNAAAMRPYSARLSVMGALVTVPDLLGYGETVTARPGAIRYEHWRGMITDLVLAEADDRPLIIVGASIGGMLAYDAAAVTGLAAAVVVTCLLDPREPAVRNRLTPHPAMAWVAGPALRAIAGPFAGVRLPIRWTANMRNIANNPGLVREVLRDRRGGGGRVSLGWMRSFLESSPSVEPEDFTTPILMGHPGDDRWTPLGVSTPFFDRIAAPKSLVVLEGCGHFPIEEPGLTQLMQAVAELRDRVLDHA
jgi:alpha-beta hydrolase superfamily lysophospholipase